LPGDTCARPGDSIGPNLLRRAFEADAPDRRWLADFTHVRTTAGWPDLTVAAWNGAHGPAAVGNTRTDVFDAMERL
jgi:transposase InsO family protein